MTRIRPSTQIMPEGAATDDALSYDGSKWAPGKVLRRVLSAGTVLTQRPALNFTGTGVAAADDTVNNRTNVTIPGYTDEQVRDVIGAALVAGTNVTVTVNDAADTITIASTAAYTDEQVRDVIGAALVAGAGVSVTVNDAADTITIASTVTQYTDEMARDAIGAALVAGTGVTITVNDAADTITIAATGGGGGGGSTVVVYPFSKTGTLTTGTGSFRLYNDSGSTRTITAVRASVGTAPTGASVIVDVNKNGTTIFTTQANRPAVAAGGTTSGKVTTMDVTSLADGDYLTVDIDQIGSTVAGANLVVQVTVS